MIVWDIALVHKWDIFGTVQTVKQMEEGLSITSSMFPIAQTVPQKLLWGHLVKSKMLGLRKVILIPFREETHDNLPNLAKA